MQNESTALTTAQHNQMTTSGLENYKIKPNLVKLMQTNHLAKYSDAIPGAYRDVASSSKQWVTEANGKLVPTSIKIIPLLVKQQKVFFKPGGALGSKPICKSADGIKPITNNPDLEPQSEFCSTCVHSSWKEYRRTKKKPACQDRPWLLFIDAEDELPYFISFTSRSIRNFNQVVDQIARDVTSENKKNANNPDYVPYNLYDYTLELGSYKDINDYGQFFVSKFENLRKVKLENKGKYRPYYEKYVLSYGKDSSPLADDDGVITGELAEDI